MRQGVTPAGARGHCPRAPPQTPLASDREVDSFVLDECEVKQ